MLHCERWEVTKVQILCILSIFFRFSYFRDLLFLRSRRLTRSSQEPHFDYISNPTLEPRHLEWNRSPIRTFSSYPSAFCHTAPSGLLMGTQLGDERATGIDLAASRRCRVLVGIDGRLDPDQEPRRTATAIRHRPEPKVILRIASLCDRSLLQAGWPTFPTVEIRL